MVTNAFRRSPRSRPCIGAHIAASSEDVTNAFRRSPRSRQKIANYAIIPVGCVTNAFRRSPRSRQTSSITFSSIIITVTNAFRRSPRSRPSDVGAFVPLTPAVTNAFRRSPRSRQMLFGTPMFEHSGHQCLSAFTAFLTPTGRPAPSTYSSGHQCLSAFTAFLTNLWSPVGETPGITKSPMPFGVHRVPDRGCAFHGDGKALGRHQCLSAFTARPGPDAMRRPNRALRGASATRSAVDGLRRRTARRTSFSPVAAWSGLWFVVMRRRFAWTSWLTRQHRHSSQSPGRSQKTGVS